MARSLGLRILLSSDCQRFTGNGGLRSIGEYGGMMERRNFLRTLLGVVAVTALPSEVWPFRKIFIAPSLTIINPTLAQTVAVNNRLNEAAIYAVELEAFKKEIPDLLFRGSSLYEFFKSREPIPIGDQIADTKLLRIPSYEVA